MGRNTLKAADDEKSTGRIETRRRRSSKKEEMLQRSETKSRDEKINEIIDGGTSSAHTRKDVGRDPTPTRRKSHMETRPKRSSLHCPPLGDSTGPTPSLRKWRSNSTKSLQHTISVENAKYPDAETSELHTGDSVAKATTKSPRGTTSRDDVSRRAQGAETKSRRESDRNKKPQSTVRSRSRKDEVEKPLSLGTTKARIRSDNIMKPQSLATTKARRSSDNVVKTPSAGTTKSRRQSERGIRGLHSSDLNEKSSVHSAATTELSKPEQTEQTQTQESTTKARRTSNTMNRSNSTRMLELALKDQSVDMSWLTALVSESSQLGGSHPQGTSDEVRADQRLGQSNSTPNDATVKQSSSPHKQSKRELGAKSGKRASLKKSMSSRSVGRSVCDEVSLKIKSRAKTKSKSATKKDERGQNVEEPLSKSRRKSDKVSRSKSNRELTAQPSPTKKKPLNLSQFLPDGPSFPGCDETRSVQSRSTLMMMPSASRRKLFDKDDDDSSANSFEGPTIGQRLQPRKSISSDLRTSNRRPSYSDMKGLKLRRPSLKTHIRNQSCDSDSDDDMRSVPELDNRGVCMKAYARSLSNRSLNTAPTVIF